MKETSIDKLARMVKQGFDEAHREMNGRFDDVDRELDIIKSHTFGLDNRVCNLEDQMRLVKTKLKLN